MTVVVLEDAAEDIESGRRFYESRQPGIGDYFIESILSDLASLSLYAGIHSIHFGFRRMLSKRFPFSIYYETDGQTAYVYAILDMRRDPYGSTTSCGNGSSEASAAPSLAMTGISFPGKICIESF